LVADETTGLLSRLGITPMFALPYNARAKPVERFFLTMEDQFGTRWPSYCGRKHDPETLKALLARYERGERDLLPTAEQWKEAFVLWLEGYHGEAHPEVKGRTRAQVWEESFVRCPPMGGEALFWPREERIVNRRTIRLHGREYKHVDLAAWNKTELRDGRVLVEFNVHDDATVRVLAPDGRWICDAALVNRKPYVTASYLEDIRARREHEQLKRLEKHTQEVRDRAASIIDPGEQLRRIEEATGEVSALEAELALGRIGFEPADDAPEIDIWGDE
jgi:putative transposase